MNLLQNSLYKAETTHVTYILVGLKRQVQCGKYAFNYYYQNTIQDDLMSCVSTSFRAFVEYS